MFLAPTSTRHSCCQWRSAISAITREPSVNAVDSWSARTNEPCSWKKGRCRDDERRDDYRPVGRPVRRDDFDDVDEFEDEEFAEWEEVDIGDGTTELMPPEDRWEFRVRGLRALRRRVRWRVQCGQPRRRDGVVHHHCAGRIGRLAAAANRICRGRVDISLVAREP